MADPTPIYGSVWKVTSFINWSPNQGWTENYYVIPDPNTTDQFGVVTGAMDIWYTQRVNALSGVAGIVATRYMKVGEYNSSTGFTRGVKNRGRLVPAGETGGGYQGNAIGVVTQVSVGWLFAHYDYGQEIRSDRIWGGWVKDDLTFLAPGATTFPARVIALKSDINTIWPDPIAVPGVGSASLVLHALDRRTTVAPKVAVTAVSLSAEGNLTFTLASLLPGLAVNKRVHFEVQRKKCVKGVSGNHRVLRFTTTSPFTITVAKKYCCCVEDLADLAGTAQLNVEGFFRYDDASVMRVAAHDRGRPFFGTAGRRNSMCC